MGKLYDSIDSKLSDFITRQQMFFVATAPLAIESHVNLSPKGIDSFRILDEHSVVYADLTGSGIETVAHIKENSRITLMFCAFEGRPNIVRLYGKGDAIELGHPEFEAMQNLFPPSTAIRAFVRVHCTRISDSCGFGVPLYEYQGQRTQLTAWGKQKTAKEIRQYQLDKNATSIDGLTGITRQLNEDG